MATLSAWRARAARHKATMLGIYKKELECKQQAFLQAVEILSHLIRQQAFGIHSADLKKKEREIEKIGAEAGELNRKIKNLENPKKKRARF